MLFSFFHQLNSLNYGNIRPLTVFYETYSLDKLKMTDCPSFNLISLAPVVALFRPQ